MRTTGTFSLAGNRQRNYFVLAIFFLFLAQLILSRANPTGGHVTSGSATITTVPGTVTVNQATTTASINWQDFSIASGELTRFEVPSSTSATLNRVVGNNMSQIYGTLQSNGQLYLINPNGIVVGASGVVNTAGFIASTLNFSDTQFNQQGNLNLGGSSTASVVNQGTIHASTGDVYLIASQVNNSGTITAPQGNVGLAAGTSVLLQKAGDQHLFVQVDPTATPKATGVTNTGAIRAASAELRAAGGNAYALAINNTGNIAATGIATINGQVYLTSDGGDITNTGTISARQANGNGGTITVVGTGASVTGNTLINCGTLDASATVARGQGGTVTLKNMSGTTIHRGKILARGGQGGAGGNVEISGSTAQITGTVDTTSPGGITGNLLLDPLTFTVAATGGDKTGAQVAAMLASSNTTISATNTVTIEDNISWTANTTLTVNTTAATGTVDITSTISGYALTVNSFNINLTGANVTTTYAGIPNFASALILGNPFSGTTGQLNITNSVITGTNMLLGYNIGNNTPSSQVTINASSVDLVLGSNNASTTSPYLQISGLSATPGVAGVSITNGSSITAEGDNDSRVYVDGTGLVSAGNAAIGVLIDDSMLTSGSAGSPGDVDFDVHGDSDIGTVTSAPATFGAATAAGLVITDGSTITSYSTGKMTLKGHAYADDVSDAAGVGISDSTVHVINGTVEIGGDVRAETLNSGSTIGAAYTVAGVALDNSTLTSTGENPDHSDSIDIMGGVKTTEVLATDNGDSAIAPSSYGVAMVGTSITASGNSDVEYVPIIISGEAGGAQSSSSQVAKSIGVSISQGSNVTNSGAGAIDIGGLGSIVSGYAATGENVVSDGVQILGTSGTPEVISATGGGSIGIGGIGGAMGSESSGSADGVDLEYANVTTTSGLIFLAATGGSGGPAADLTGLNLAHTTVQTGTSGSTAIPNGGGDVPPTILILATDSSLTDSGSKHSLTFTLGSASGSAIAEDPSSALITENLAMTGDFYDVFKSFAAPNIFSAAPSFSSFNNFISGGAASTIATQGITLNPTGTMNLTSTLNQIETLDGVLVGTDGFELYDNSDLVVGTIGGNDNLNYGEVDEAGLGPVTIHLASGDSMTLTNISPITGTASDLPVIATTGTGSNITLVTSGAGGISLSQSNAGVPVISTSGSGNTITLAVTGTGDFVNTAGATALSVSGGASYALYAPNPGNAVLDGLTPAQTIYNTNYPGPAVTANTLYYASGSPLPGLSGIDYIDSGTTAAPANTTIDLVFDGTLLGSTTTNSSGAFNFMVSSTDLTSGILLTDPLHDGNTYYQATIPATTITGVDIWGSTLRVMANTASNTALGTTAGSLTTAGINYSVLSAALTTNEGINMIVLPMTNYNVEGNITVANTLTTDANSVLTTSTPNTTLSAHSLALGGSLNSTGAVTLTATSSIGTSGAINVGSAAFSAPDMTLGGSLTTSGSAAFNATGTITDTGTVDVGSFLLQSGTWSQIVGQNITGSLPAFSAGDFELLGESTFERFAGIDTTDGNADEIADVYGLQGLASPSGNLLGDNAELVDNIDASGTSNWNAGAGFVPIGNSNTTAYSGTFNGQGYTIDGLTINTASVDTDTGLFGLNTAGSTIKNVGVTNVNITGGYEEGGLIGNNLGTINNAYSTGTVTGVDEADDAGGLVGENGSQEGGTGTITNSYSTAAVNGGLDTDIGGLCGFSFATLISHVYSTGTVTGNGSVDVGGLVGDLRNPLNIAYSSGAVSDVNSDYLNLGGLVGYAGGATITNAFSIGSVTTNSGGGDSEVYVGGLVGYGGATISNTYTTSSISFTGGSLYVGGFEGYNTGSTISNSFWDTDSAGSEVVSGVGSDEVPNTTVGVFQATTAELQSESYIQATALTEPTFDFTNVWTTYNDSLTPQLIGLPIATKTITPPVIPVGLPASPGNPDNPVEPINNSDTNPVTNVETLVITVFDEQGDSLTINTDIVPGAGGVAPSGEQESGPELHRRLKNLGNANTDLTIAGILQDIKDGSPVNTGSSGGKLSENSGFSQIVHLNEYAQISQGVTQVQITDPVILNLFQQQAGSSVLNELSQAAGH